MEQERIGILSLLVGNILHFIGVIFFYLALIFDIGIDVFFYSFITLLYTDLILNLVFFILIIPALEQGEEVTVSAFFFILTSAISRLVVAVQLLLFKTGEYREYVPSFLYGFLDTITAHPNLIALSSVFFSIAIYYLSKDPLVGDNENLLRIFAIINMGLSVIYLLPSFGIGQLLIMSNLLFLFKSTILPLFMIGAMYLWFQELKQRTHDRKYQLAESKGFPDIDTFEKYNDKLIRGKYPDYPTYQETHEIIEEKGYPDFPTYRRTNKKLEQGDFPTYEVFSKAKSYGINDYATYQEYIDAIVHGEFPDLQTFKQAQDGDFQSYEQYKEATNLGLSSNLQYQLYTIIQEQQSTNFGRINFGVFLDKLDLGNQELLDLLIQLLQKEIIDGRIETNNQAGFAKNALIVQGINVDQEVHGDKVAELLDFFALLPPHEVVKLPSVATKFGIDPEILRNWIKRHGKNNSGLRNVLAYNSIDDTIHRMEGDWEIQASVLADLYSKLDSNQQEQQFSDQQTSDIEDMTADGVWQKQEDLQERLYYAETLNDVIELLYSKGSLEDQLDEIVSILHELLLVERIAVFYISSKGTKSVVTAHLQDDDISTHWDIIAEVLSDIEMKDNYLYSTSSDVHNSLEELQVGTVMHNQGNVHQLLLVEKNRTIVSFEIISDREKMQQNEIDLLRRISKTISGIVSEKFGS